MKNNYHFGDDSDNYDSVSDNFSDSVSDNFSDRDSDRDSDRSSYDGNYNYRSFEEIKAMKTDNKKGFNPNNYISLRDKINTNQDGTANLDELCKLERIMLTDRWQSIDPYKLTLNGRTQIRYLRKNGLFITGGFLLVINVDFFMFRGHVGKIYSLQKDDIEHMWFKRIKKEKAMKVISFKKLNAEGIYEVKHKGITIFRSSLKNRYNQFMKTKKYQKVLQGEPFMVHD
jgi:hypothetical protein